MVGERLGEIRKDNGMTQKQFAKAMTVSEASVSAWEREITCPDDETKVRIAKLFNVSLDYLLGLTDTPVPVDRKSSGLVFFENLPSGAINEIRVFFQHLKEKYNI